AACWYRGAGSAGRRGDRGAARGHRRPGRGSNADARGATRGGGEQRARSAAGRAAAHRRRCSRALAHRAGPPAGGPRVAAASSHLMRRAFMGARSRVDASAPLGLAVARLRRWLSRWTVRRQLVAGFGLALLPLILLLAHTVDERFAGRRAEELRS